MLDANALAYLPAPNGLTFGAVAVVVLVVDARQLRAHGRRVVPRCHPRLVRDTEQDRQRMVNVLDRAAGRPCATPVAGPKRRWVAALASVAVMLAVVGAAVMAVAL
jgi:hypothetical protein